MSVWGLALGSLSSKRVSPFAGLRKECGKEASNRLEILESSVHHECNPPSQLQNMILHWLGLRRSCHLFMIFLKKRQDMLGKVQRGLSWDGLSWLLEVKVWQVRCLAKGREELGWPAPAAAN